LLGCVEVPVASLGSLGICARPLKGEGLKGLELAAGSEDVVVGDRHCGPALVSGTWVHAECGKAVGVCCVPHCRPGRRLGDVHGWALAGPGVGGPDLGDDPALGRVEEELVGGH
jgi:hypothetical protein